MPRADTESSTDHIVHASLGDSSDADARTKQRVAPLRCLVRACSSCAPDGHHELLPLNCSAERVSASGARAAAVRRAAEHMRGGHAKAATQLAAIAGRTQRPPAHGFLTPQARMTASDGRARKSLVALSHAAACRMSSAGRERVGRTLTWQQRPFDAPLRAHASHGDSPSCTASAQPERRLVHLQRWRRSPALRARAARRGSARCPPRGGCHRQGAGQHQEGALAAVSRHPARQAPRTACPILLLHATAGLLLCRCAPRRAAGGSTRAQRSTSALQGSGVCAFRSADAPLAFRF